MSVSQLALIIVFMIIAIPCTLTIAIDVNPHDIYRKIIKRITVTALVFIMCILYILAMNEVIKW